MKTKMRYLTTLLVATAATGAAIGFSPAAIADPGMAPRQGSAGAAENSADPGYWNGGAPAGGTGIDPGTDNANGPGYWRGGAPAGGTGIDPGTDNANGPGYWSGGESAGAV
jgi:hypothetical protein